MANNLRDIRRRIKSVKNTQQITKAMKMVSASKFRRASERAVQSRPYAERIFDVHHSILQRMPEMSDALYQRKDEGKSLIVPITADKGLCGSFNSAILKRMEHIIAQKGENNVIILPIGKKADGYFKRRKVEKQDSFVDIFRQVDMALAERIGQKLIALFRDEPICEVILVFNRFKSVLVQEVTEDEILPLALDESKEAEVGPAGVEHLAEPGLKLILEDLGPRVVLTRIYQALLESSASEHAARMTAMDAATNNAVEMIGKLTLDMNKARQASITNELIEIVSGAAAL